MSTMSNKKSHQASLIIYYDNVKFSYKITYCAVRLRGLFTAFSAKVFLMKGNGAGKTSGKVPPEKRMCHDRHNTSQP